MSGCSLGLTTSGSMALICCFLRVQVTLSDVELYDAVHYAAHILRSEAVALVNVTVWGDPLIPASSGVVIDGSRRVFVGGCSISTADNAIGLKTTAGVCMHPKDKVWLHRVRSAQRRAPDDYATVHMSLLLQPACHRSAV